MTGVGASRRASSPRVRVERGWRAASLSNSGGAGRRATSLSVVVGAGRPASHAAISVRTGPALRPHARLFGLRLALRWTCHSSAVVRSGRASRALAPRLRRGPRSCAGPASRAATLRWAAPQAPPSLHRPAPAHGGSRGERSGRALPRVGLYCQELFARTVEMAGPMTSIAVMRRHLSGSVEKDSGGPALRPRSVAPAALHSAMSLGVTAITRRAALVHRDHLGREACSLLTQNTVLHPHHKRARRVVVEQDDLAGAR